MPALPNAKREKFCQLVAAGSTATHAYTGAGYTAKNERTAQAGGARLLSMSVVQLRLQELGAAAAKKAEFTVEEHLRTLAEIREEARQNGQAAAAVQAEVNRGKCAGFYVERIRADVTTHKEQEDFLHTLLRDGADEEKRREH